MDRIDTSLLSSLTLTPASKPVGPRLADPTARLRIADRQDTVELRGVAQPDRASISPLVAGTVADARPPAGTTLPAAKGAAANAAMRMYASPADQNAAATRAASNSAPVATGSTLDVTA
ncbi:MAG: hypothetical protein AAFR96_12220 [Planctomycetota bacterium]